MVLTRRDKPVIFQSPQHVAMENLVFAAMRPHLPDLGGKRVLDLGCGWGGYGHRFAEGGSHVIFVDGRPENLAKTEELTPGQSYVLQNVTAPWWTPPETDIALCIGILYHVGEPLSLLAKLSKAPLVFVETMCIDHDGAALVTLQEDTGQMDWSLDGPACRPSPGWVKESLEGFGFSVRELHVDPIEPGPSWPGARWTWDFQRTCGWRRDESQLRKLFVARR